LFPQGHPRKIKASATRQHHIIAIFLIAPGLEVMGVTMLSLWTNGDVGELAAFATLQIVMIAALLIVSRLLFKVKIYD
jgi:iron(III) transport system permease protein